MAVLDIDIKTARNVAKECTDLGAETFAIECDATKWESVDAAYQPEKGTVILPGLQVGVTQRRNLRFALFPGFGRLE